MPSIQVKVRILQQGNLLSRSIEEVPDWLTFWLGGGGRAQGHLRLCACKVLTIHLGDLFKAIQHRVPPKLLLAKQKQAHPH